MSHGDLTLCCGLQNLTPTNEVLHHWAAWARQHLRELLVVDDELDILAIIDSSDSNH
jgi:hypothetical protein